MCMEVANKAVLRLIKSIVVQTLMCISSVASVSLDTAAALQLGQWNVLAHVWGRLMVMLNVCTCLVSLY